MLALRLLGQPQVVDEDGNVLAIKSRKLLHLLAYLWLHRGRSLPRDKLAGVFWPESREDKAQNSLRNALTHLRHILDTHLGDSDRHLAVDRAAVCLEPHVPLWVDAARFDELCEEAAQLSQPGELPTLERATELYQGPFVEGCYEEWCLPERDRLRDRYKQCLERLVSAHMKAYHHQTAIEWAQRLLALDPLQEHVHQQLMRLYYQTGQRHRAIQQYTACRNVLDAELQADPELQTQDLYRQILNQEIPIDAAIQGATYGKVSPMLPRSRLAILPFASLSDNADDETLAIGLTEDLIAILSKFDELQVVANSSVMPFKGSGQAPSQIGRELQAGTLLTGHLQVSDDQFRLHVRLIDTDTEEVIWAERYDRALKDFFALQDDLTHKIAESLQITLQDQSKGLGQRRRPHSWDAYYAYLQGRYFQRQDTAETLEPAFRHFERAIEFDPEYAAAYAELADCHIAYMIDTTAPPEASLSRAESCVRQALSIDDNMAQAHEILAYIKFLQWKWDDVELALTKAIQSEPESVRAHALFAQYLVIRGRPDEALPHAERAVQLDPQDVGSLGHLAMVFGWKGQHKRAIELVEHAIELAPYHSSGLLFAGGIYFMAMRYQQAIEAFQQVIDLRTSSYYFGHACIAVCYAHQGKVDKAQAKVEDMLEQAHHSFVSPFCVATGLACLSRTEEALDWLREGYQTHDPLMRLLKCAPFLPETLRTHSRYAELVERMGL